MELLHPEILDLPETIKLQLFSWILQKTSQLASIDTSTYPVKVLTSVFH